MNTFGDPFAVDSPPPNIPLPEAFQTVGGWSYSSNPFISPCLTAKSGGVAASDFDPDVIIVPSPDKVEVFHTPQAMQYILLPPPKPPTENDPTGMKAMMDFLGFKKEYTAAAGANIDNRLGLNQNSGQPQPAGGGATVGPDGKPTQPPISTPSKLQSGPTAGQTQSNQQIQTVSSRQL
jgi:hypothetical protein